MGTSGPPRPHVVVHTAVSVDGSTTGFETDIGTFYRLAGTWHEDVTLTGADTILAQEAALAAAPRPGPAAGGALLAVVDSRARVREWAALREAGYWSDVVAVTAERSPAPAGDPVERLVVGADRVDLAGLLDALARRPGVAVVRVDSGGGLTGALLGSGLVDEVSLLVHPVITGEGRRPWWGTGTPPATALALDSCEALDGGLVWLRYRVRR